VGAHGWVAGIASCGSVILSRDWLVTVEALDFTGTYLPYSTIQLLTAGIYI